MPGIAIAANEQRHTNLALRWTNSSRGVRECELEDYSVDFLYPAAGLVPEHVLKTPRLRADEFWPEFCRFR